MGCRLWGRTESDVTEAAALAVIEAFRQPSVSVVKEVIVGRNSPSEFLKYGLVAPVPLY